MRRFLVWVSVCLLTAMAGCSSAPKVEETKAEPGPAATGPAPAAPVSEPASAASPATAAPADAKPVALTTDEQKTIYAVGLALSRNLESMALSDSELELVKRALSDAAAGKPAVDVDTWGPKIENLIRSGVARHKARGKEYAEKAAAEPGAMRAPSGLVYREITAGKGASPTASDRVRVHYRGTLLNGSEFDSSYKRNAPAEFPLSGVIPCWTEGVQKMKVGGKSKLVCPSDIAYKDDGRPGIPGGATLLFEVELLGIL